MTVPESGAVESDGTHLWWTDGGGTRKRLDDAAAQTLATTYAAGSVAADQTMTLLDAKGGGVVVNGTGGGFTGTYDLSLTGKSLYVEASVAVGVDSPAAPTARVHVAGGTAAAGSAPLKLDQGLLMTVPESGAVESDGTHLWWTDGGGTRKRLDDAAAQTLATTYAAGSVAADQTMTLLDAEGGGVVLDGRWRLHGYLRPLPPRQVPLRRGIRRRGRRRGRDAHGAGPRRWQDAQQQARRRSSSTRVS